MSARMRLRRADGEIYLDRFGWEHKPVGGIFLHKMSAPDPGIDLHDHPWAFVSIILWGGYVEERAQTREAPSKARAVTVLPKYRSRGDRVERRWGSVKMMRLDECHRVIELRRKHSWSLCIHGPVRRVWGFYLPDGWMFWENYDKTVRAERRDLYAEISSNEDPKIKQR